MLLNGAPQRRAICRKVTWMAPKKPNSARRKITRVYVAASRQATNAYIPGETHNLQAFSSVLIRGGRVQDLPGINYKVIRGVYDCSGLPKRSNSRSKYGAKRPRKVRVAVGYEVVKPGKK